MIHSLILHAILRDWRRHPWQILLSIAGVAAGVAAVAGIDISNQNAELEFKRANSMLEGLATHRIVPGGGVLSDEIFRLVKVELSIEKAAPVILTQVNIEGEKQPYKLLGIDPFSDFRVRQLQLPGSLDASGNAFPIYMSSHLRNALDLLPGAVIKLKTPQTQQNFVVQQDFTAATTSSETIDRLFITDIAAAQKLTGRDAGIDFIDLILNSAEIVRLQEILPPTVRLISISEKNTAQSQMTRAFMINLQALSLLALLVGAFLVFNTIQFQVVRRRRLFGLLRSVGVAAHGLLFLVLAEALLIGLIGSGIGLLAGLKLSQIFYAMVTQTISNLYYNMASGVAQTGPLLLLKTAAVGLGASLLAALAPGIWVRFAPVKHLLNGSSYKYPGYLLWVIIIFCLTTGIVLISFLPDSLIMSFAGLFFIVIGLATCAPQLMKLGSEWLGSVLPIKWFPVLLLTLRNSGAHVGRTGIAGVALAIAVAATLGVGLMIDSFRFSVDSWLKNYLRGDIYVRSLDEAGISERTVSYLEKLPGVAGLGLAQRLSLQTSDGVVKTMVLETSRYGFEGFQIKQSIEENVWEQFSKQGKVLVSEAFAAKHLINPGDTIELTGVKSAEPITVAAVFYDYSTDQGLMIMHADQYKDLFGSPVFSSASLYLAAEVNMQATLRTVAFELGEDKFHIRSNASVRKSVLAVFDRTFLVTEVVRWLALLIAVIAIVSCLWSLMIERAREFAMLRSLGLTPMQMFRMILFESGWIGLITGLVALPIGVLLSTLLINIINVRSFGWTMFNRVDPGFLVDALVLAVVAALLGGLYPACRMFGFQYARHLHND